MPASSICLYCRDTGKVVTSLDRDEPVGSECKRCNPTVVHIVTEQGKQARCGSIGGQAVGRAGENVKCIMCEECLDSFNKHNRDPIVFQLKVNVVMTIVMMSALIYSVLASYLGVMAK